MKLNRSIPYFNTLLKSPNTNRMSILQAFPNFVVDDLIEVLYNIVVGNADIGSKKSSLRRHKKTLLNLVHVRSKKARRTMIYNQKGGFIAALLPIILGILGPMLFGSGGNSEDKQ